MANIIQTLRSFVTTNVPAGLIEGQLAVNVPDKKIWIGNATSDPVLIFDNANVGVKDHTLLTNIGTNTHAQIDTEIAALQAHIADVTSNPHAVTAGQVGAAPTVHTHVLADVTDSGTLAAVDDDMSGAMVGRQSGAWVTVTDFAETDVVAGQGISVSRPGDGTVVVSSSTPTSVKANWKWNTAVAGDPGANYMLGDTASGATVTALSFSYTDADGNDVTAIAGKIKTGDQIQLLRDNAGTPVYSVWEVTADAIDNTTYATVPVVINYDSDPAGSPAMDDLIAVQWTPTVAQPPIAHTHDHLVDITNVGTNTHDAIDLHIAAVDNPHAVTAAQVGAEPANANIQAHVLPIQGNPHGVTAADVGASPTGHNLGTHGDVVLTTPAANEALAFDGTNWINQAFPAGVTVHANLGGLDADDHPQYLTVARADVLYSLVGHTHDAAYAPLDHNHDAGTF